MVFWNPEAEWRWLSILQSFAGGNCNRGRVSNRGWSQNWGHHSKERSSSLLLLASECLWICPVNIVTDSPTGVLQKLNLKMCMNAIRKKKKRMPLDMIIWATSWWWGWSILTWRKPPQLQWKCLCCPLNQERSVLENRWVNRKQNSLRFAFRRKVTRNLKLHL